ncbi:serine/threonine protein kinase [Fodinibius roseus]|uniref:Serine/threonine protein kinase n=1 Tax=Fodinibius roseus TaxID=1194090 RepID=A0A1M5ACT0_9BACT|nr:tetratricopeptide repeat protein [Fodinibius roseus]SHF28088.1 serine/threonine protein kinase [Fodinibius roseus]
MDKQHWKKLSHIFDLALTLSPERRTTYIRNLCAGDPELRQEVSSLLSSIEESDKMLEEQLRKNHLLLSDLTAHLEKDGPSGSLTGKTVGHWKVSDLLGRGGMGEVYEVERFDSDIQQKGALKIMRRGLDTPENIRRFRLEKQILAGLNHPNIARLIDGGISEDGLPYLVMEFVDGVPIDRYCDQRRLTISDRLALFREVCRAVQHAHKNLIVHRDLKPENILIAEDGHVKILDFGIAKILDETLYELSTVKTHRSMRLMSLEAAAPEQISGDPVTTSADVYALGTLLYQLLAGRHPLDIEEQGFRAIEQMIMHEDPLPPSRRLNDAEHPSPSAIADKRNTDQPGLTTLLRGDLDAITLKALRKETGQRYESVIQLIADLDRFRADKPVSAQRDSTRYRLSKFFKRHKKRMGIAAAAVAVITVLTIFYTFQLAKERNEAQLEAQKTEQVKDLLVEIFQRSDPFREPEAKNLSVQEVLDRGTQRVSSSLESQPLVRAELQEALGSVYSGLIMYPKAEPLLRKALATYKRELGPDHPDVAETSQLLGFLLFRKGAYEEAEALFKEAARIYQKEYGETDTHYADILSMLGNLYAETGRQKQALRQYISAIEIYKQQDSPGIAGTTMDLGYLLMDMGRMDEAQRKLARAIPLFKTYSEEPDVAIANALTGLGQVLHLQGDLAAAEDHHRKALQIRRTIFETGHTYIASSHLRLAWVLLDRGNIDQAVPLARKACQSFKNHLPAGHWKIAASEGVLALAWIGQGEFAQAEETLLNTHEVFREQFGVADWRTQSARQTLVKLYKRWDKSQKAQAFLNN